MQKYFRWFYNFLIDQGMEDQNAAYLNLAFNIIVLTILLLLIDYLFKYVIIRIFKAFSNKTKTSYDDYLVKSNFPKYVAHLVPFLIIRKIIPFVIQDFPQWEAYLIKVTDVYLIILMVWVFRSIVKTTKSYLSQIDNFKDKPLESYAQIVIVFIWFIGAIFIFSEITDQSILQFLATLGAASAVLLLVFKDTILGFVTSIQVSVNDIVRIGDWITQEKYGADGNITEINLTTVKVQNFDNTITTIPTYSLISESFKNWRGMQESGGRRIKRALNIKQNSVKFLSVEDLQRFSEIQMVAQYIDHRQKDIDKYNNENSFNKELAVNGRNQTNLGLFRKYCDMYLNNHPAINKDMMIMTRHLAPSPQGIPLEVYAFSSDKRWINYEHITADIFEHLIAASAYFDLELYEEPSGKDLKSLKDK
ncbi:mechanosensitive ion channel family protein [Zhouia spongiae]|uniref:Mechanosensitive ion channel family protein n=1 Tax=Zhouia spongiae TaxID=2202721 RepID=A0ABY3YKL1_9FLAO|nr:mechanosensitive ion channel domain-containing protein [Zhouia spongiae]UNY98031.1 mechanosensitive ion channel family protein [Zhouia spongiae]